MSNNKILVAGDVKGNFESLLKRVKVVNAKAGPFELLFCVGEFFSKDSNVNEPLLNGDIVLPISTYILGPCSKETEQYYPDEGGYIAENVTYLGSKGMFISAQGLKIAYMSGVESNEASKSTFDKSTVNDLIYPVKALHGFIGCDILLTSEWPKGATNFSNNIPKEIPEGSILVSQVAAALKPRYHFAGLYCHYERTPYRNHRVLLDSAQHVTRFISLASVDNELKEKWLYAFSIAPITKITREQLVQQPDIVSEFPYMDIITDIFMEDKRKEFESSSNKSYTKFDFSYLEDDEEKSRKRKKDSNNYGDEKRPNAPCWFCLSNNETEKHLIVSIGTHCYAAMPKGPLDNMHVLIMPINHTQSLVSASEEIRTEIQKYIDAFTLLFSKEDKALVVYERNYKTFHSQINLVPIPNSSVKYLRTSILNISSVNNIDLTPLDKDTNIWDIVQEGMPYFYFQLPDGSKYFTNQMKNFPLQFGREILCSDKLLNNQFKVDWKNCIMSKLDETNLAKELQNSFKPFDPFGDDDDDSD
uniref:CWF19-like protein 1 homolog n=1 Tax=Parastrongyloides trichosuri TaxID=131310 RepID=A0A0N4Z4K2_PARTI